MNNSTECLQDALFTAAHSYSATTYEASYEHIIDPLCDDLMIAPGTTEMSAYAFAQ